MTGTPMLNRPQELFSLLHLVDPIRFSSERKFLNDYCYPAGPNRYRFLSGGLDRLTNYMSEFFIQRNREDAGIHIPPPAIRIYKIDKDLVKYKKQYEAERTLRNNAALVLENGDAVSMLYVLEIILRERQIMTWPAGVELKIKDQETGEVLRTLKFDVEESQKIDEACELLTDLVEEGERVIVFSKFKAPLYEMRSRFPEHSMVVATGDQSSSFREQVVKDFDLKTAPENPRWQVCFGTYDAFATGLNLNAARHIILLDDEWSPGMEDQAIGRIDRLNSVDQANVHIFRVNDSIDDFMAGLIEEKRELTEGFEGNFDKQRIINYLRGE
jgi:SNF2 family DNA or RNA helicase